MEKTNWSIITQVMDENLLEHFMLVRKNSGDILAFDSGVGVGLDVYKIDSKDDILEILKHKHFWCEAKKSKVVNAYDDNFKEPNYDLLFGF